MIECRFTLELTKNGIQKTIYAKSGELNSRKVVITLTESGRVFDSHLYVYRAYCREEDSTSPPKYWDDVKVANGCVEFTLPDEWLTVGDKVCELKVYSGTESLLSPLFTIVVAQSLGESAEAVPTGKDVRYQEALPDLPEGSAETGGEVAVFNPEENQVRRVKLSEIVVDETDPTVPAWAKQANPPAYSAEDVGALPAGTFIPTKISQLANDSNYQSEDKVDGKIATVVAKIPTKSSQLINDSNYQSESEVDSKVATAVARIPTKISQLTNDKRYNTESEVNSKVATAVAKIPTKVSQLNNDSKYLTEGEVVAKIPTKISQLSNDRNFVTDDEVDEKGNELLSEVPNRAEVDGSTLKLKRDNTELFEVELPESESGITEIPVATNSVLGGVKVPKLSEIKIDSGGNIGINYGALNGYSIAVVLATALLESESVRVGVASTIDEANTFVQNEIYGVLDGIYNAVVLTSFESGELTYLDENYEEKTINVYPNSLYVFKLVDYVVTVRRYESNEIRQLILEGV
jgi:hypothetical protein